MAYPVNARGSRATAVAWAAVSLWLAAGARSASPAALETGPPPAGPNQRFFLERIQPVFAAHCYGCHSAEAERIRGGLRLDTEAGWTRGGDSGQSVVLPREPERSLLIRAVRHTDPDLAMPPRKPRLPEAVIADLVAWVAMGAPDAGTGTAQPAAEGPVWWSLQPLRRPVPPQVTDPAFRVRNVIDSFVVAKLGERGLPQSPEADRRTLIRRLSFDLTGLPPTTGEVQSFLSDQHPQAYERLVERLLASPRSGERWARHWLDVVHYGDTHGYDKDQPRPQAWPYRDYVIRAFNEDKPYARFVQEQVAGDVLFPNTRDGIEALGFIAAGPWDLISHQELPESKVDGKIARHLDRDDMASSTIQTFNSLTLHCAQCHPHKFDPISQEDYYRVQAVFAALDRADKPYLLDPALHEQYVGLIDRQRRLAVRQTELESRVQTLAGEELQELDRRIGTEAKRVHGNQREEFGYHSALAAEEQTTKWVQVDLGRSVMLRRIVLRPGYDDFNQIGGGFGFPRRYRVEVSDDADFAGSRSLVVARDQEDVVNPGTLPQSFEVTSQRGRFVRVTAVKLAPRLNDFIFALAELEVWDEDGQNRAAGATVTALDSIEAPPRWRRSNLVDGISPLPPAPGELAVLREQRAALLARTTDQATARALEETTNRLADIQASLAGLPKPSWVYAGTVHHGSGNFRGTGADGGKPRPIHLLDRGNILKPRGEVGPGALMVLPDLPGHFDLPADHPEGARRAALARWLTDPRNPLTWRSFVNRVWHYHFGRGLVDTPNDFGRQGARPTHPELLDWLACEFRDGGQSLKALHRLIVTSATYRQSSGVGPPRVGRGSQPAQGAPPDPAAVDRENRYLWRMNRRKLEAEAVRDSVLFVSGRLDLTMGGPPFRDFVLQKPEHSPHYRYDLHDPDDPESHRRSVYRFIVRSQLQPFMTSLDCADPSMRVDRRNESLSPLQALAMLNDGLILVMARRFAEKLEASGNDDATRIERGFGEALGRPPTPAERDALVAHANRHGMANVCRTLFNLNEFLFVD